MGKAKRKINKLERKKKKQEIKPRIPVAPPSIAMKSKKDYDRSKSKQEVKKMVENDIWNYIPILSSMFDGINFYVWVYFVF